MQVMIPAVFDRKAFDTILRDMTDDDAAVFAAANIGTFPGCFSIGAPRPRAESSAPVALPEPKAPNPAIDKEALMMGVRLLMAGSPKLRAEEYAAKIAPSDFGATEDTIGPAVKRALERLVRQGKVYFDGDRRRRRYWLAAPAAETPEAAE